MKTSPPRLAVCAILKDEVQNLPRLVTSTDAFAGQWVVVDTGSTDGTQAKLQELLGDRLILIQDKWDDDFARVRNIGLAAAEEAGADWCFVLDGDDILDGAAAIVSAIPEIPDEVGFCAVEVISPRTDGAAERMVQPRLFRASEKIRYAYPVHAYPDLSRYWTEGEEKGMLQLPDCVIRHHGYTDPAHLLKNFERTVRIMREKDCDPESTHRLYYEGRALMGLQRWDEACEVVGKLVDLHGAGDNGQYLSMLARCTYYGQGDILAALHLYAESLEINPGDLDNWYGLLRVVAQGFYQIGAGHLTLSTAAPSTQLPALARTLRGLTDARLFATTEEEMGLIEDKITELFPEAG